MDIDWRKAPEGATHFDPTDDYTDSCWMMMIARKAWCYFNGGEWESVDYDDIAHDIAEYVPRPTKPSEPEWDGEGWPPAECECEFKTTPREGQTNFADEWENCIVKYAGDSGCFLLDEERDECFMDSMDYNIEFRPIRTKEQRERDELIDVVGRLYQRDARCISFEEIADSIIAAGYRKERDK